MSSKKLIHLICFYNSNPITFLLLISSISPPIQSTIPIYPSLLSCSVLILRMDTRAQIPMDCSPSSHFKHHPLISLALLLLISSLLFPLSPTFFTLLVLVLSSVVLFTGLRKKKRLGEQPNRHTTEEIIIPPKTPREKEKEGDDNDHHHQEATRSGTPVLLSDCEGVDVPSSTSNDDCSEADWSSFQYTIGSQIPPPSCSDGSISSDDDDDDSLIEIALPGGQYVVGSANGRKELFWSHSPAEFLFHNHQDELLSGGGSAVTNDYEDDDVNLEEDNLIEIDISAGSIKWPRHSI